MRIIAGWRRWRGGKANGLDQVPALIIDVDDDTATRIILADNRTAEFGTYDDQILSELPRGLGDLDSGMEIVTDAPAERRPARAGDDGGGEQGARGRASTLRRARWLRSSRPTATSGAARRTWCPVPRPGQLAAQLAAALDVERLVDGLVARSPSHPLIWGVATTTRKEGSMPGRSVPLQDKKR